MIFSQIFSKILRSKATTLSKNVLPLFLAGLLVWIFSSCSTTRIVPIETIHRDTLYINKEKYDSIYVYQDKYVDRSKDTILIKELQTEYRYKFLRDSVRIVQRDSIPYEVRITEVKQVKYIPPWCKYLAWIGGLSILLLIASITLKIKQLW